MRKILALFALLFAISGWAQTLVEDIDGSKVINVGTTSVSDAVSPGTWYVLYNRGRKAYLFGDGSVTSQAPMNGYEVNDGYKYLVRLVETENAGKYNIQTAAGKYYKELTFNTGRGTSVNKSEAGVFTFQELASGHWGIKGATYYLDSDGSVALGYGTSTPSVSGNSDWAIYPVSLVAYEDLSGGALAAYHLIKGGLFRIQSRGNATQFFHQNKGDNQATTSGKVTESQDRMCQMWIIERNDEGKFSLRNAQSGKYLQDDYTCKESQYYWTIALSPNNTSTDDPYMVICHGELKSGTSNCANLNSGSSGLCNWYYNNDRNSEWTLQAVSTDEVSADEVKQNIDNVCKTGILDLEAGQYYQFISLTTGDLMTERFGDNVVVAQSAKAEAWNQYWKVSQESDGTYVIQSLYSNKYLNRKATGETSACGGNYLTNASASNNRFWKIEKSSYPWETTYNFIEVNKPTTALAIKDESGLSFNDLITSIKSQWVVKKVDLTEEQLAQAQSSFENDKLLLNANTILLNSRLQKFFTDYACTSLKDEYKDMSDEDLRAAMIENKLPTQVVNMALKIKNDTWGHREKEFRIYDYEPYSDWTKWNSMSLVGTGYQFSPQTGPTGISVKSGDIVLLYVSANPAASTTLEYSSLKRYTINGSRTALKRGINIFLPKDDGFIYIHHTITNTGKTLASVNPITVHIEGGRVQGYFDITRGHKNADWKDMVATLFQDEIVHLKSKYYQFNMHYEQLKKQIPEKQLDEIDTDGIAKGIEGTLHRWDQIVAQQREIMGAEQFKDRFNCMLSASSSSDGNPYASSYGTYYPGVGGVMNYDALTHGTEYDHGGNFWCIAHETGHVHQSLYNMVGCTEISNNNFSQLNTWLQGSNTGRGGPWKEAQTSFHNRAFWNDYDLWQRSRAYFQLWLYFHLMEHDTTFYPRLFDMFRKTPMTHSNNASQPGSGTTDYLRFAKFACDVAQADLSEFFQFWGFFVPVKNYVVEDYSTSYLTTTQAEIDEAIEYMHKYPKKLGNIMFIDERIEKYPASYPGAPEGTMRLATTPGATPGRASEVGETGMMTMFVDNPEYKDYSCTYSRATGRVIVDKTSGKGAVGFKVYNSEHKLINVYNTYNFVLPEGIRYKDLYILAALGDGTDRLLYDPKNISAVESVTDATDSENVLDMTLPIYNLQGQQVAKPLSGEIYIQKGKKIRMK